MKSVSDQLTKYVPLSTAVLLSFSVMYDYFFLRTLGLSLSEVPTTIQDHARSALVWLPGYAAFCLGLWVAYGQPIVRTLAESTDEDEPVPSKKKNYWWPAVLVLAAVMLAAFENSPTMLVMAFVYLFFAVPKVFVRLLGVDMMENYALRMTLLVACIMLPLFVVKAYSDGHELLRNEHKWSIGINTIDGSQIIFASGIRTFSESTVIVQLGGNPRIVKNSDITGVVLEAQVVFDERYICRVFNVWCDDPVKS